MNSLGYINIYWLREFMLQAIGEVETWLEDQDSQKYCFLEMSFMIDRGFNNRTNILQFIEHGLLPAFKQSNSFQRELILDAIALLISQDNDDLWKYANNYVTYMGNEYKLTEDCLELFSEFLDILMIRFDISLSSYTGFPNFFYDETDTIELYRYC